MNAPQPLDGGSNLWIAGGKICPVAREQPHALSIPPGKDAKTVAPDKTFQTRQRVAGPITVEPNDAGFDSAVCSAATTWAPSPTAAATRFTDFARTLPMAKTPRRVVSKVCLPAPASPVSTKPLVSSEMPDF